MQTLGEDAPLEPRREGETSLADTVILTSSLQDQGNTFRWFKPPSSGTLLWQLEQDKQYFSCTVPTGLCDSRLLHASRSLTGLYSLTLNSRFSPFVFLSHLSITRSFRSPFLLLSFSLLFLYFIMPSLPWVIRGYFYVKCLEQHLSHRNYLKSCFSLSFISSSTISFHSFFIHS